MQVGYNKVSSFDCLSVLKQLPSLNVLYLEHNPLAADYEYRMRLGRELPSLVQIDATACRKS